MARLVDENGNEVKIGTELTDFRGDKAILKGFREPHKPSSTGRVIVDDGGDFNREFFPSVYDLKIVDHQFDKKPVKLEQISEKVFFGVIK